MKGNEIFSVGITNNNQIKITTSENPNIILDIHSGEQLARKLTLLVNAIKAEEEEARNLKGNKMSTFKLCRRMQEQTQTTNKIVNIGIILFWVLSFVMIISGTIVITRVF